MEKNKAMLFHCVGPTLVENSVFPATLRLTRASNFDQFSTVRYDTGVCQGNIYSEYRAKFC